MENSILKYQFNLSTKCKLSLFISSYVHESIIYNNSYIHQSQNCTSKLNKNQHWYKCISIYLSKTRWFKIVGLEIQLQCLILLLPEFFILTIYF